MANLESFDEKGLHRKIDESGDFLRAQESIETSSDLEEAVDAFTTGLGAMIELAQRGHTTPEQEQALQNFLEQHGLSNE